MGFWDFYAADRATFVDRVASLGVPVLPIGGVLVPVEEAATVAYGSPSGMAGMLVRLLIAGATYKVDPSTVGAIAGDLNAQAQSAGFGQGGSFGGSFGWKAEPTMAALIIPGAFRVAIEAESGGQPVTNVIGVSNGSGTAAGAAAAVQTAWKVNGGPLAGLTPLYALLGFRAVDLGSANGSIAFIADNATGGLASGGSKATNAASALVKWNGGTRSRSSRGRMYYGPLSETQINPDGRTLASTPLTSIGAAFTAFRNSLTASGYPLVVLSPTTSQAFPVTSSTVESVIASQRRRIRS